MSGWWLVLAVLGCSGGGEDPIDERTPLEAPDAEWMVSFTQVQGTTTRVWTAYRMESGVEAAAGKGAVPVADPSAIEGALEAFLADAGDAAPIEDGSGRWTIVVEHDGRQERVVTGELDAEATALQQAIASATGS